MIEAGAAAYVASCANSRSACQILGVEEASSLFFVRAAIDPGRTRMFTEPSLGRSVTRLARDAVLIQARCRVQIGHRSRGGMARQALGILVGGSEGLRLTSQVPGDPSRSLTEERPDRPGRGGRQTPR